MINKRGGLEILINHNRGGDNKGKGFPKQLNLAKQCKMNLLTVFINP